MNERVLHISGTGVYLPDNIITSKELDKKLNKAAGWVEKKSGVKKRHFVNSSETTSYMATKAAINAIEKSGIKIEELDCIIGACGVMEQPIPCTAAIIQKQLGLENSGITAFDINSTCLSFLTAFDNLSYMINMGRFKNVLIVASDIPSIGLNWQDMESCTIFGDGAGAVILSTAQKNHHSKIIASHMETYSKGVNYCQVRAGGTKLHPSIFKEDLLQPALFEMDGKAAYKLTSKTIDGFLQNLFKDTELELSDIDLVIPHQASKLALQHLRKKLGIKQEKLIDIFSEHGNQVAASIPNALHFALSTNKIKKGDKLLLIGTGAGISLGGIVMEYNQ